MGAVPKSRISKGRRNRRRAHDAILAGAQPLDRLAAPEQAGDAGFALEVVIAGEVGAALDLDAGGVFRAEAAGCPAAIPLGRHFPLEAFHVQAKATLKVFELDKLKEGDIALIASSGAGENHIAVLEKIAPQLIRSLKRNA